MNVTPRHVFFCHLVIIMMLGLAFGCVATADQFGHHRLLKISSMLRLGGEGNLPSFFSAMALLACATAANAARMALPRNGHERKGWAIFACVFLFMGVDEAVSIHEMIVLPHSLSHVLSLWHVADYFYYAGIFPYLLLAIWLGLYLFPFWLCQSNPVRVGLAVGGILYVLAAIGMELVENHLVVAHVPHYSVRMAVNFALEELGEMLAVAIFLQAFLTRLAELGGGHLLPVKVAGFPVTEAQFPPVQTAQAFRSAPKSGLQGL